MVIDENLKVIESYIEMYGSMQVVHSTTVWA